MLPRCIEFLYELLAPLVPPNVGGPVVLTPCWLIVLDEAIQEQQAVNVRQQVNAFEAGLPTCEAPRSAAPHPPHTVRQHKMTHTAAA